MNSQEFCRIAAVPLCMFQGGIQKSWFGNAQKTLVEVSSRTSIRRKLRFCPGPDGVHKLVDV